eukprot:6201061-Pleurochrysis_carterae.AAC.1
MTLQCNGEPSTVEVSTKHLEADSCADGVTNMILDAAYLQGKLYRTGEFDFKLVCETNAALNADYSGFEALVDNLINNLARRYFRPFPQVVVTADDRNATTPRPDVSTHTKPSSNSASTSCGLASAGSLPAPNSVPEPTEALVAKNGATAFSKPSPVEPTDPSKPTGAEAAPTVPPEPQSIDLENETSPAPNQEPPSATSWIAEGMRCKMCFDAGVDAKCWFGGLVGGVGPDSKRIIGFDDGDLQTFTDEELHVNVSNELLSPSDAAAPGMVENVETLQKACSFSTAHEGGRGATKTVGVLVGLTEGELFAKEQVYAEHHVCSAAFGPPPARTTRRGQNQVRHMSQQERLGFHTFRRGDIVKYLGTETGEAEYQAVVYGVVLPNKKEGEQGRKILILYDKAAAIFFLGLWTDWQRVHTTATPADVEDNATASSVDLHGFNTMKAVRCCALALLFIFALASLFQLALICLQISSHRK